MPTTIELISAKDAITFSATPDASSGWVYDNESLDAWYELPPTDPKISKRPNSHGDYGLGTVWTRGGKPIITGQYYGVSAADALTQRNRLNAMYADGKSVTMRVTDELGTTTRTVWLLEAGTRFRYDFSHFPFDVALHAPDGRRYGVAGAYSTGMPSAGGGLFWDLGTAPSGLYLDWGGAGISGMVPVTNVGTTLTNPRIEVGGAGAFAAGFRITEIETGRELTLERETAYGEIVVLDSRTQKATIGQGDVSGALTSREWFAIPAGETRRYQINPLGAVTDAPTMTVFAAPAYM